MEMITQNVLFYHFTSPFSLQYYLFADIYLIPALFLLLVLLVIYRLEGEITAEFMAREGAPCFLIFVISFCPAFFFFALHFCKILIKAKWNEMSFLHE